MGAGVTNSPNIKATLPNKQDAAGMERGKLCPPPLSSSLFSRPPDSFYIFTSPTTAHRWTPPSPQEEQENAALEAAGDKSQVLKGIRGDILDYPKFRKEQVFKVDHFRQIEYASEMN